MRVSSVCLLLPLAACATVSVAPGAAEPETVKMEPVKIRAEPDPLTGLDAFDAGDLLERGNALFDAKDFDKALRIFEHLLDQFPDSALVATAKYNMGLCFERLAEFELAAKQYQTIIDNHPNSTTAKDAYYRSGLVLSKLERWGEVERAFWALRQQDNLTPMDELEARVGLGIALFMQQEYATADKEFLSVLTFYRNHSKKEFLPAKYWVSQARFYLGEIAARQFEATKLASTAEDNEAWKNEVAEKLERKCELLLRAQNNFIRAIREGHTGWATAAGYRIGSLYERLYDDMMNVPTPPGIDAEATSYYREELQAKVAVLVKKAIDVYERSLDMATRVGEQNEWVERTEKALERMKTLALQSSPS